jgi:small neutral amino acid transporter SnatA (MarC family)
VTLNPDGSFSGTAHRTGHFQAMIGACSPAFAALFNPVVEFPDTCAVTHLAITVTPLATPTTTGPGSQLPLTGARSGALVTTGLFLLAAGLTMSGLAARRTREPAA